MAVREIRTNINGKLLTKSAVYLVRKKGLEPSRTIVHMNLNHARLPVPPFPHIKFLPAVFCGAFAAEFDLR